MLCLSVIIWCMSAAQSTSQSPLRHRCIIWHAAHTVADPDLIAALMSRRMHVVACSTPFDALAHVCAAARGAGVRGPGVPTPATLLVLSDPGELPGVVNVVTLTGRYAARAACWTFEASGSRRLRPIERSDIEQWERLERASSTSLDLSLSRSLGANVAANPESSERPVPAAQDQAAQGVERSAASGAPVLRLAGEGPIAVPNRDTDPLRTDMLYHTGKVGGTRQHLSEEELQMLLAIDPERGQN